MGLNAKITPRLIFEYRSYWCNIRIIGTNTIHTPCEIPKCHRVKQMDNGYGTTFKKSFWAPLVETKKLNGGILEKKTDWPRVNDSRQSHHYRDSTFLFYFNIVFKAKCCWLLSTSHYAIRHTINYWCCHFKNYTDCLSAFSICNFIWVMYMVF